MLHRNTAPTINRRAIKRRAAERLNRLVRLRELKAPRWIIKHEQALLAMNYVGYHTIRDTRRARQLYGHLHERFIAPLMNA